MERQISNSIPTFSILDAPLSKAAVALKICSRFEDACIEASRKIGDVAICARGGNSSFHVIVGCRTAMGPSIRKYSGFGLSDLTGMVSDSLRANEGNVWLYLEESGGINSNTLEQIKQAAYIDEDMEYKKQVPIEYHNATTSYFMPDEDPMTAFLEIPQPRPNQMVFSYCIIPVSRHKNVEVGSTIGMKIEYKPYCRAEKNISNKRKQLNIQNNIINNASNEKFSTADIADTFNVDTVEYSGCRHEIWYVDEEGMELGQHGVVYFEISPVLKQKIENVSTSVETFSIGCSKDGEEEQTITFKIPEDVSIILNSSRIEN